MTKAGVTLTRAELGVLLAYAKITLYDDLLASTVPDDAYLARELFRYFPQRMEEAHSEEITNHRLRREIIATMLANSMINRGGATFMIRLKDQTGATVSEIAQAFVAVRNSFELTDLNEAIDELDNKIDGMVQLELYSRVQDLVIERVIWFKRNVSFAEGISDVVERFGTGIKHLAHQLTSFLEEAQAKGFNDLSQHYVEAGVPLDLANRLAWLPVEASIPDIVMVSEETEADLEEAAKAYFEVAARFRIGAMDALARELVIHDYYDGLALERARATLAAAHRSLAIQAIMTGSFESWLSTHEKAVERMTRTVNEILDGDLSVSKFSVAASLLAEVTR